MIKNFTSADEKIVRIHHPVIGQELADIAEDCDLPLQWVFNAFCKVLFERADCDAILVKVVADCEAAKNAGKDIPY